VNKNHSVESVVSSPSRPVCEVVGQCSCSVRLLDSGRLRSSVQGHGSRSGARRQVRCTLTNRAGSVSTLNTTSSHRSQRAMAIALAEQWVALGDLRVQFRLQHGSLLHRHQGPRRRQGLGLPVEQVVDRRVEPGVGPAVCGSLCPLRQTAAGRAAAQLDTGRTGAAVPAGVPPTLISAPSRRPKRSLAAAISRPGVAGSALSATTQAAVSAAAPCCVRRVAAAAAVAWWGALSTTRAPSVTSAWAAANPRPRLPPVTR
jgi:hypothetical protein